MADHIQHYDPGDVWTPEATFVVNDVETDPTEITVKVKAADGTVTTHGPVAGATGGDGITRVSAGVYTVTVDLDDAGYWFARFEGTGAAAAAVEHQAIVDPSEFYENAQIGTRALVTLAEAKDWLEYRSIDASNDLELARVINDISDRAHHEAEREFKVVGTNPQPRTFPVDMASYRVASVHVGDLASYTAVEIIDTDWATVAETVDLADITAYPSVRQAWEPIRRLELNTHAAMRLRPGMRVRVTGNWGFPAVPGNVRQAVLDAVAATRDRDVEQYRTDLGGGEAQEGGGTVLQVTQKPMFLSLPASVLAVFWSYRQPHVA